MESIIEIAIANDSTYKVHVSGATRYLKSGKWSKKIAKSLDANHKTKGIVNGRGKVTGSFKIEVNEETFNCCFEYNANEASVIPPAFTCNNRDGDVDSCSVTVTYKSHIVTERGVVGMIELSIATPKPSAYQLTVINKTNKLVQVGKLVSSGKWTQRFQPTLPKNGSSDTAKAVAGRGNVTGSFLLKADNEIFCCSFSYEARVSKPTFFAYKKGSSVSPIMIKGNPVETQEGKAETVVSIESSIKPKSCSSYGIAVLNGTSDQCDVLVTDQQLTNHGTMAWQRNFQESNVHLNYAKAIAEGLIEGSFKINVNEEVFDCKFSYDVNTASAEPSIDITTDKEPIHQLKIQTPVEYDGVALVLIVVMSPSPAAAGMSSVEEDTMIEVQEEICCFGELDPHHDECICCTNTNHPWLDIDHLYIDQDDDTSTDLTCL